MSSEAQPIQVIIKQKDEATFIKISVLMDQITSDLKNQTTTASQPTQDPASLSSRRCYCPRDDELKTARRLLRSRSDHRSSHKTYYPSTACRSPIQESGADDEPTYDVPVVGLQCSSPSPQLKNLPVYYNVSSATVACSSQSALLLATPSGAKTCLTHSSRNIASTTYCKETSL